MMFLLETVGDFGPLRVTDDQFRSPPSKDRYREWSIYILHIPGVLSPNVTLPAKTLAVLQRPIHIYPIKTAPPMV